MNKKFKIFILRLTILTLGLGILGLLLHRFLPEGTISGTIPYLLALFYIITAVVHYILLRISTMNPRKFVGYFMLATFLKLLNYLVVIVVYVLTVKEGIFSFILTFFILYIIYTAFEVLTILAQTKE
jgi:hypothetical protein